MYAAKRFSCGPGADSRDPTKQFYITLFVCNTVLLVPLLRTKITQSCQFRQTVRGMLARCQALAYDLSLISGDALEYK